MAKLPTIVLGFLALSIFAARAQDHLEPEFKLVRPSTPPGVTMIVHELAKYPEHTVQMIAYVPEGAGPFAAILQIHGGGWNSRQVENDKPLAERLAVAGYVTAIVSYRLSTEAKYPACLHDCKAAIRFLRAKSAELKIDPTRIGVMGGSAGGHLSALTAMTNGMKEFEGEGPYPEQSSAVQACVAMAATMDLVAANGNNTNRNELQLFGKTREEAPDLFVRASPLTHVRAGVPPVLFIEGEKDRPKLGRAEMMEKLTALGIDTEVRTLKYAPHPFWMSQPWLDQTVEIADGFFQGTLGKP